VSPGREAALFTMILTAWAPRFSAWRLRAARQSGIGIDAMSAPINPRHPSAATHSTARPAVPAMGPATHSLRRSSSTMTAKPWVTGAPA
jgi:hypothetical protein